MGIKRRKKEIDQLTISKCKRLVRPLVSKIHALNDTCIKYKSTLEFKFPYEMVDQFLKIQKENESTQQDQELSLAAEIKQGMPVESLSRKKTYKRTQKSMIRILKGLDKNNSMNRYKDLRNLLHPRSSSERLNSLKPYISSQLFNSFNDIFEAFKGIINFMFANCDLDKRTSSIKLSTIAALNIGEYLAENTKTTYYKLNNSALFDSKTLRRDYRDFAGGLYDDIDESLGIEPEHVGPKYRDKILIGYVIHLLLLNSRSSLFLLMPILIHWLEEVNAEEPREILVIIKRSMFNTYWNGGIINNPEEDTYNDSVSGINDISQNAFIFWFFLKIGYWENFFRKHMFGTMPTILQIEDLLLDGILGNDYFNIDNIIQMQNKFENHDFIKKEIASILVPFTYKSNAGNVFIFFITKIIRFIREIAWKEFNGSKLYEAIAYTLKITESITEVWMSEFAAPHSLGNNHFEGDYALFDAIIQLLNFLENLSKDTFHKLKNLVQDTGKSIYEIEIRKDLIKNVWLLYSKAKSLATSLSLIRAFIFDIEYDVPVGSNIRSVSGYLLKFTMREDSVTKQSSLDKELQAFMVWLNKQDDVTVQQISKIYYKYHRENSLPNESKEPSKFKINSFGEKADFSMLKDCKANLQRLI